MVDGFLLVEQRQSLIQPQFTPALTRHQVTRVLSTTSTPLPAFRRVMKINDDAECGRPHSQTPAHRSSLESSSLFSESYVLRACYVLIEIIAFIIIIIIYSLKIGARQQGRIPGTYNCPQYKIKRRNINTENYAEHVHNHNIVTLPIQVQ